MSGRGGRTMDTTPLAFAPEPGIGEAAVCAPGRMPGAWRHAMSRTCREANRWERR